MFNVIRFNQFQKKQSGAVLIVALIILAVVTILGVAGMRNSTLELRMATSLRDRTTAFQVAETALAQIEQKIYNAPFQLASFLTTTCPYAGQDVQWGVEITEDADGQPIPAVNVSTGCFTSNCAGGLCFNGTFANPEALNECRLTPPVAPGGSASTVVVSEPWHLEANWSGGRPQLHEVIIQKPTAGTGEATEKIQVPYLVEFMCFVPRTGARVPDEDMLPLYRVTVRAATALNRAEVMVQSTFEGPRY